MFKSTLVAVCFILIGHPLFAQDGKERARIAAEAYQQAVYEARSAYIKELELAIKEVGAKGDLKEANRLADEKESLELEAKLGDSDPLFITTRKLENTRWDNKAKSRGFLRFLRNNRTKNHLQKGGVWIASDERTVISQSQNTGNIYLFKFDEKYEFAIVHRFENANKPIRYKRR